MAIPREAEIRLVPEAEAIQFNPRERVFFWSEGLSVHLEKFILKAADTAADSSVNGRLTVFFGSIILAEIKLLFNVLGRQEIAMHTDQPEPDTPVRPFRRIFPSYSHKDLAIVEQGAERGQVEAVGQGIDGDTDTVGAGDLNLYRYVRGRPTMCSTVT